MSSVVLRLILAGLLTATVAAKIWGPPPATEVDIRTAVVALIALRGWSAYDEAAGAPNALGKAINFQAPECDGMGQVFPVDLGLQLAPMLNRVVKPGYTRRFVYMGRAWAAPDRFGMRLEWLKNRALSLLRVGRYVANETVLVITEPDHCRMGDKVDWSAAWERGTLTTPLLNRTL